MSDWIRNKPSEIVYNTNDGIYIKYIHGCDYVTIKEDTYKIESLKELISILEDIITFSDIDKNH